jgi:hypothetical protein
VKETVKEKRLRLLILVIIVSCTAAAFLYRSQQSPQESTTREDDNHLALVLHQSTNINDYPQVVLYQNEEQKHVVAIYDIELRNQYRFHVKESAVLNFQPEELATDTSGEGFWAKTNTNWYYFNERLEVVDRSSQYRKASKSQISEKFQDGSIIAEHNGQRIDIPSDKQPLNIHSLATDGSIWLLVFENEVKIATVDTEYSQNN